MHGTLSLPHRRITHDVPHYPWFAATNSARELIDLKASIPASMSVIDTPNSDSSATTTSKAAIESTPRSIKDVSSLMFAASIDPPVAFEIIAFNWSFNTASANLIHHLPTQMSLVNYEKRVRIHVITPRRFYMLPHYFFNGSTAKNR